MSHGRFDNPLSAALAGFADRFRPAELAGRFGPADRFDGQRVLVTGAGSGLGLAFATEAARRGGTVTLANRSRIPEAGDDVRRASGSERVAMRRLDLSDLGAIHAFCTDAAAAGECWDVVVLNAAVTLPQARRTACGQDEMFLVNYLANFMLVHLLLQHGLLALDARPAARIIVVSSDSHQGASAVDYAEFGRFFDHGVAKSIANYSYFKLLLNTFATELHHRLNGADAVRVAVNVICPGPVNSNIIKEAPPLLRAVLRAIFTVIFQTPDKAARPLTYLAASRDFAARSNVYLHMFREKAMDPKVYDRGEGARLWQASADLWRALDPRAGAALQAFDAQVAATSVTR